MDCPDGYFWGNLDSGRGDPAHLVKVAPWNSESLCGAHVHRPSLTDFGTRDNVCAACLKKYRRLPAWLRRHWIVQFVLILLAMPVVIGIIGVAGNIVGVVYSVPFMAIAFAAWWVLDALHIDQKLSEVLVWIGLSVPIGGIVVAVVYATIGWIADKARSRFDAMIAKMPAEEQQERLRKTLAMQYTWLWYLWIAFFLGIVGAFTCPWLKA